MAAAPRAFDSDVQVKINREQIRFHFNSSIDLEVGSELMGFYVWHARLQRMCS